MGKGKLVIIFDGHGTGIDKGAGSGKFEEFGIVRKMCRATYEYILKIPKDKRNFLVEYPEKNEQMTITEQTEYMDTKRREGYYVIGIEEHMNSAAGTAGDGAEIWINNSTTANRCASCILKEFKMIGQNSRGIKHGDLQFTNNGRNAALITEFGFVNNPVDRKIFDTDKEIRKAGEAIAKGLMKAL